MSKKKHVVYIPEGQYPEGDSTWRWNGTQVEVELRPGEIVERRIVKHAELGTAIFPAAWVKTEPVEEVDDLYQPYLDERCPSGTPPEEEVGKEAALVTALEQVKKAVEATGHARHYCQVAFLSDGVLSGVYASRLRDARKAIEVVEQQLEIAIERGRRA